MKGSSGSQRFFPVIGVLFLAWFVVGPLQPCPLHSAKNPSAEPGESDTIEGLPPTIRDLMMGERGRIDQDRSHEGREHSRRPLRLLVTADVDTDRDEEILEDLYIARLGREGGDQSVYIIVFWNDAVRLPDRVIQTRTWKVDSYVGSLQVTDVNRDGVDDYLGRLQVVPTTMGQPRTELFRKLLVSSRDEKGAFRPAHILGKQAQMEDRIPTIEDVLNESS